MTSFHIGRRGFLAGAAAVGLAACSDDAKSGAASGTSTPPSTTPTSSFALAASFPQSGFAVPGVQQRLPFLMVGSDGAPLDSIEGPVAVSFADESGAVISRSTLIAHSDGVPRPYLPVEVVAPSAGTYLVTAEYKGSASDVAVLFAPPERAGTGGAVLPQPGSPFPAVPSPTIANPRGVDPICTREPPCPLHADDIVDTLGANKPMAVIVSTPLYCQTNVCGPVLDLVMESATTHPDVTFIHCEVYANPLAVSSIADADTAAVPEALGLPFEPSMFLVDRGGLVTARLDTIFDRAELNEVLSALK